MTILMIEDNPIILRTNQRALELAGYRVLSADTLTKGKEILAEECPDLILLDILLPDGNGLEYCRELFGKDGPRILFLSALNTKASVIAGLRAGGDDYMTKPYLMEELLARIDAILRRQPKLGLENTTQNITKGPLTLNVLSSQAFLFGQDMLLGQKEFALLLLLVQKEGEVLPKEVAYEKIWGQPMAGDSRALYVAISRLKNKLKPAKERGILLLTKWGSGYQFIHLEKEKM